MSEDSGQSQGHIKIELTFLIDWPYWNYFCLTMLNLESPQINFKDLQALNAIANLRDYRLEHVALAFAPQ